MTGVSYFSNRWETHQRVIAFALLFLVSVPAWSVDEVAAPDEAMAVENIAEAPAPAVVSHPGRVARAIFTTAIVDREPVDNLESLSNNTSQVYFFSDLRELAGQIVTHRWEYDGEVVAEITFKVGTSARWRVYSSKNLLPEWTGTWTVVVSNESGQAIQTASFEYVAAPVAQ